MNTAVSQIRILPAEIESPVVNHSSKGTSPFGEILDRAVTEVDRLDLNAQGAVADLLSGKGGEVHGAMIAVEKADLSFQLLMQVRNKVVQAYQEVARMQF